MRSSSMLLLGLLFALASSTSAAADSEASLQPPLSSDLRESGPRQRRWLSLPNSRIVVNPYDYWSPKMPAEQAWGGGLPLHAAYYAGGGAVKLRDMLMLYTRSGSTSPVELGWTERFADVPGEWAVQGSGRVEADGDGLLFRTTGPMEECLECAATTRTVEVDLDRCPWIQVEVPEAQGHWALKVRDPDTPRDIPLQHDISTTGTFAYNVRDLTGWAGRKTFELKFFTIGLNKPARLSSVRFLGFASPARSGAEKETSSASWAPHELLTTATLATSETVTVSDRFYNLDTLVREYGWEGAGEAGAPRRYSLAGRFHGKVSWDPEKRLLSVQGTTCSYALAFSNVGKIGQLQVYPSQIEFLAGQPAAAPKSSGLWALDLELPQGERRLACTVGFAPGPESSAAAARHALLPFHRNNWRELSRTQETFWNIYLRRVPRPANFQMTGVDPLGVTADEVRRHYYTAWVFLGVNSLPVMPETGYPYPQLACGKPSVWLEGHPKARPSASWESLFAMQFYAYLEPEVAWRAFEGLMSLVEDSGRLGGESLPSRKAQTAVVLHSLTGATDRLARVYDPLKRHLLWARENPRWIHGPHDFPDEKDADFVASLLYDLKHMERIAGILNRPEEERYWVEQGATLLRDYYSWFWTGENSTPVQIYRSKQKKRSMGNSTWVASGLAIPEVTGPYVEGLLRRFHQDYNPGEAFAGLGIPKYPEVSLLVYGLHDRGMKDLAGALANTAVREVVRSSMFAEQYFRGEFPHPDGVRPSVFGATLLIDMIWLKNGFRMEQGRPLGMELPNESGRVENLPKRLRSAGNGTR